MQRANKEGNTLTWTIIVNVTQYNPVELQPASMSSCVIFGGYTAQHKAKTRPENGLIPGERERQRGGLVRQNCRNTLENLEVVTSKLIFRELGSYSEMRLSPCPRVLIFTKDK